MIAQCSAAIAVTMCLLLAGPLTTRKLIRNIVLFLLPPPREVMFYPAFGSGVLWGGGCVPCTENCGILYLEMLHFGAFYYHP